MGRAENDAYEKGLARGRNGDSTPEGMLEEAIGGFVEWATFGLIKEPDSVKNAREGGFVFGQNNPAAAKSEELPQESYMEEEYDLSYDEEFEDEEFEDEEFEDEEFEDQHELLAEHPKENAIWKSIQFVYIIQGFSKTERNYRFFLDDWLRDEFEKQTHRSVTEDIPEIDAKILQAIDQKRQVEENPYYPFSEFLKVCGVEPADPTAESYRNLYRMMLTQQQ